MDQILQRNIHSLRSARRQGEETRKYLDVEVLNYLAVYGLNIESEDHQPTVILYTTLLIVHCFLYSFIISQLTFRIFCKLFK